MAFQLVGGLVAHQLEGVASPSRGEITIAGRSRFPCARSIKVALALSPARSSSQAI
ncbi:hypothetical protein ACFIOY_32430 [Bradyrhizobium sp. TZ2]